LALVRRKEVVLFVHGYHTNFERAALTMGELCHFLGREFVCGIFSWPAGSQRGVLFGYGVDRESAEYAAKISVKTIRIVGRTPGVERVHLIAHSRGNRHARNSAVSTQRGSVHAPQLPEREFHIAQCRPRCAGPRWRRRDQQDLQGLLGSGFAVRREGRTKCAATACAGPRVTVYVSPDDKAMQRQAGCSEALHDWGAWTPRCWRPNNQGRSDKLRAVDIIQVRGTNRFVWPRLFRLESRGERNMIAMLRYGLRPGERPPARADRGTVLARCHTHEPRACLLESGACSSLPASPDRT
jgi:esterase/lipase superfamily enzyme